MQLETGRPPSHHAYNPDKIQRVEELLQAILKGRHDPVVIQCDPHRSAGVDLVESVVLRFLTTGSIFLDPVQIAALSVSERRAFKAAVLALRQAGRAYREAAPRRKQASCVIRFPRSSCWRLDPRSPSPAQLADLLRPCKSVHEVLTVLQEEVGGNRDPRAASFVLRVSEAARVLLPELHRQICRDLVSYMALDAPEGFQLDHVMPVHAIRRLMGKEARRIQERPWWGSIEP